MSLLDHFLHRRTAAVDAVREIAAREARGKTSKADAEKLAEALTLAGTDERRYSEIVDIFQRAEQLRAEGSAEQLAKAEKAHVDAIAATETEDRRHAEAKAAEEADHRRKLAELDALRGAADAELRLRRQRAAELDALMRANAELFRGELPDLTTVTPVVGDTLPRYFDEAAPVVHVSRETWQAEDARRRALVAEARAQALAEHQVAMDAWRGTKRKRLGGAVSSDDPPPAPFTPPSWRQVVEQADG